MQARHPVQYLYDDMLLVDKHKIRCQVIKSPYTSDVNHDYLIIMPGGPGFGREMSDLQARELHRIAQENGWPLPHIIIYDPLGCGESDAAFNPSEEYTVPAYAKLNAKMLEALKEKLNIKKMNITVNGGSFGSIMALYLPILRPHWVEDGDIRIKQILSVVGADGSGMKDYTFQFLNEHYANHPNLPAMKAAQEKLFNGDFKNQPDYIRNFLMIMAPVYMPRAQEFLDSYTGKFLNYFPRLAGLMLRAANRFIKWLGFQNNDLALQAETVGGCSLPVLNQFFKSDFNGIKISETVRKNVELFKRVPITFFLSKKDHVINPEINLALQKNSSSECSHCDARGAY